MTAASEPREAEGAGEPIDRIIRRRYACRRFSDRVVPQAMVADILDTARYAPSAANTQPWRVYVLGGALKEEVGRVLLKAHDEARDQHSSEYTYYASPMPDPHLARREEFGRIFYGALNIDRTDMPARAAATGRNYTFFGAPIGLIVTIDRRLEIGSWLDLGIFLQNVMLTACARGLETCPQETLSKYHKLLRQLLPIADEEMVVCGMSMGYPQERERNRAHAMPKLPVAEFTRFFGFDAVP